VEEFRRYGVLRPASG